MAHDYVGKTALITGASSGIGEQFARSLAARGANLVLVARRADRLDAIAKDIESKTSSKVTTISLDLASVTAPAELVKIMSSKKVKVDVLINNAGFGTNARLQNQDLARISDEIALNVATLTQLTASFLPGMIKRDSGIIVNIASTAAYQAVPGMSVYAATKAFVLSFTEALWGELKGTQVKALAVSPGATATAFFDIAGATPSSGLAPIADVVTDTLKELDKAKSGPSIVIGRRNKIMSVLVGWLPRKNVIAVSAGLFLHEH